MVSPKQPETDDSEGGVIGVAKVVRAVFVVVILAGALLVLYFQHVAPLWQSWRFRSQSLRILSEAQSVADLKEAVGELGFLFELGDGAWIAVRCGESHGLCHWSKAVAADSTGNFYESDADFRGRFAEYRARKRAWSQGVTPAVREWRGDKEREMAIFWDLRGLYLLDNSANLNVALPQLFRLGFARIAGKKRAPLPEGGQQ